MNIVDNQAAEVIIEEITKILNERDAIKDRLVELKHKIKVLEKARDAISGVHK